MTKRILFFASIILIYSACSTKMNVQEAKRRYDAGEYAMADRLYGLAEKDVPDATRMRARCKFEMKDIQGAILLYQSADKATFESQDWLNYCNALQQIGRGAEVPALMLQAGITNDTLNTMVTRVDFIQWQRILIGQGRIDITDIQVRTIVSAVIGLVVFHLSIITNKKSSLVDNHR